MRGEVLHALGITGADDRAVFRVAGTTGIQEVDPRTVSHPFNMGYNFGPPPDSDWLDSRQTPAAPLYQQRQDEYYWYVYTPEKILYIHLKFALNAETGETLADFFNRAFAFADAHDVEKVVLDIRNNGGGTTRSRSPLSKTSSCVHL